MLRAVPLIPMQLVHMMAVAQMRARERLQMLQLFWIVHLQDQPLHQPSINIHSVSCALCQVIIWNW